MTPGDFKSALQARLDAAGLSLAAAALGQAEQYYDLLCRWNAATNLTALPLQDFPARTLDRLFIEPWQASQAVEDAPLVCVDVGSGGGSPAIPMGIVRPALRMTMVESVAKKAAFLREAVRAVGLEHAGVVTARIEDVEPARVGAADLILVRGVRMDLPLAAVFARLLAPGGRVLRFGSRSEPVVAGFRDVDRRSLATGAELVVLQASS